MKNAGSICLCYLMFFGPLAPDNACAGTLPADIQTKVVTGKWELGASYAYPNSLRNFQYTFDLSTDNAAIDITLESSGTEVSLWLYDPLGQLVQNRRGGRVERISVTNQRKGTYRVVAGTNTRGATGSFKLSVAGAISDLTHEQSATKTAKGSWHTSGGGYAYPGSLRNHAYQFEVTENGFGLDVVLESPNTNISLWLYDPLGQLVANKRGGRSEFIVANAKKGNYTVVAGTHDRSVLDAGYILNVNGKITELVYRKAQDTLVTQSIASGAGYSDPKSSKNAVFTFDVTQNNSSIDVSMESPDFDLALWLYDYNNELVAHKRGGRTAFIVSDARKGKYRIVCGTQKAGESGSFKLSLVSEFTNFKKN